MEDELDFLPELPDLDLPDFGTRKSKCPGCGANVASLIRHVCEESAGDESDACYTDLVSLFSRAAAGEISPEEKKGEYQAIKSRYSIGASSHLRQTVESSHMRQPDAELEIPPSEAVTYETPAWCLDCLRKHTDLAIGLLDESRQFFNQGEVEKCQKHAEEAIRQISLAELHASSAPQQIREEVKFIGAGLRQVRKGLYQAHLGLRSRAPEDGSAITQGIEGLNRVMDDIHSRWVEVV